MNPGKKFFSEQYRDSNPNKRECS